MSLPSSIAWTIRHGFFLFGIPRLVSQHSFHLGQQKRQEFQAAPPLHQKRLHYSRYLHDNILHQEDINKRSLHPHFDVLVGRFFFFYTRPLFIVFWYRWWDIIWYKIFFPYIRVDPLWIKPISMWEGRNIQYISRIPNNNSKWIYI